MAQKSLLFLSGERDNIKISYEMVIIIQLGRSSDVLKIKHYYYLN